MFDTHLRTHKTKATTDVVVVVASDKNDRTNSNCIKNLQRPAEPSASTTTWNRKNTKLKRVVFLFFRWWKCKCNCNQKLFNFTLSDRKKLVDRHDSATNGISHQQQQGPFTFANYTPLFFDFNFDFFFSVWNKNLRRLSWTVKQNHNRLVSFEIYIFFYFFFWLKQEQRQAELFRSKLPFSPLESTMTDARDDKLNSISITHNDGFATICGTLGVKTKKKIIHDHVPAAGTPFFYNTIKKN